MRWKVQLIAETASGQRIEGEIATIEREDLLSAATVGLTIAEGKVILEGLQRRVAAAQDQHHGGSMKSCVKCGAAFRVKGYYNSTLRTVYGNVPMRVRRLRNVRAQEILGVGRRCSPRRTRSRPSSDI
jgi:hypothetical protein